MKFYIIISGSKTLPSIRIYEFSHSNWKKSIIHTKQGRQTSKVNSGTEFIEPQSSCQSLDSCSRPYPTRRAKNSTSRRHRVKFERQSRYT